MYYIPQEYTPDNPYYSRKGRTMYRKHPVFPRNYTQKDIDFARKYWEQNNVPLSSYPNPPQLWINIYPPSTFPTKTSRIDLFHLIYSSTESFTWSATVPSPINFVIQIVINNQRTNTFDFYPIYLYPPNLQGKSVSLTITNSDDVEYGFVTMPFELLIYPDSKSNDPLYNFVPSAIDPIIVEEQNTTLNLSNVIYDFHLGASIPFPQ